MRTDLASAAEIISVLKGRLLSKLDAAQSDGAKNFREVKLVPVIA